MSSLFVVCLLAGCNDHTHVVPYPSGSSSSSSSGSSSSGSSSSSGAPAPAATANFSAAASSTAGTAVAFDASASTSSNGSALQYFWDFGDGAHGGGATIAHVFAAAGTPTVTLKVIDAANVSGTVSKTVSVAAAAPAAASTTLDVLTLTADETAIDGVTVTPMGGAAVTTDTGGKAVVSVGTGVAVTLKVSKSGYSNQFVKATLPVGAHTDGQVRITMRPRDAALSLPDAAAGGTLSGRDGAMLTLPAQGLIDANGNAVSGPVSIALTPVDVTQPGAGGFPGDFAGVQPDGTTTNIVSMGTTEFILGADGAPLQLAPGKTATIQLPIYAAQRLDGSVLMVGDTTPLWSLDENSGQWIQEGTGTVVASSGSPSGLALQATVSHFSWWNSDLGFDPYGPQPNCVADSGVGLPESQDYFNNATICNMLAQIDRTLGGNGVAGATTAAKATVRAVNPRIAGYARTFFAGRDNATPLPVPANTNVKITAYALNGTWKGELVVNGPVGKQEKVVINMRPLTNGSGGSQPEAITLPFDDLRFIPQGVTDKQFTFTAAAGQWARISLRRGTGSTFTGSFKLLQGSTVISSGDASNSASVVVYLPSTATYTIDVTGDTVAAFELVASLQGGVQTQPALSVPDYQTWNLPAYVTGRSTFTLGTATTLMITSNVPNADTILRVLKSDGTVLWNAPTPVGSQATVYTTQTFAAGTYTVEAYNKLGNATPVQVSIDKTRWLELASGLTTTGVFQLADLVLDRNNAPVIAYVNTFANNGHTSATVALRRFANGAWSPVGTDLTIDRPCQSGDAFSFAFDSANNVLLAYGFYSSSPGNSTAVMVKRFANGAWSGVGPNEGTLPATSTADGACTNGPALQIGTGDVPVIAYQSDSNFVVQHFDGSSWTGLANPGTGDVWSAGNTGFDLKVDAGGKVWFVMGVSDASNNAMVRRFNTTTSTWDSIGGGLPQTGASTIGLHAPKLRFDAAGSPVVVFLSDVSDGTSSSGGLSVYRFDGAQWSTTGGYQPPNTYVQSNNGGLSMTLSNGQALVAWTNTTRGTGTTSGYNAVVVQANTASGWTRIGDAPNGEVPEYYPHALTSFTSYSPRLVNTGSDVYLAVVVTPRFGVAQPQVMLLKWVAN